MGEGGAEKEAEEKSEDMEDFMIKKLFHGGSGGFNGDGTPGQHGNWGNIQPEYDWFIRRSTIETDYALRHPRCHYGIHPKSLYRGSGGPASMQGESESGEVCVQLGVDCLCNIVHTNHPTSKGLPSICVLTTSILFRKTVPSGAFNIFECL